MDHKGRSDRPVDAKQRKAARYSREQNRFEVFAVRATMQAEHGDRIIEFEDGSWSCTCDFFRGYATCSHVMALESILLQQAKMRLANRDNT